MGVEAKTREFPFSDKNFDDIRNFVFKNAGISLSEAKRELVYSRLARRLRQLDLTDFNIYCKLLEDENGGEFVHCINAITTNLTFFFREPHHFDYLADHVIPEIIEKSSANKIRIWSAGCSTGEEPYTLAMVLKENTPAESDIKILATDLDSNVVAHAVAGIYTDDRVKGLTPNRLQRWFKKGKGERQGLVKVSKELQAIIRFRQLNLMHAWPMKGPFDIIFCRNVVIYFSKDTQKVLFDRYADILAPNGYLFIGHSESLFKTTERFKKVSPSSVYQRIS